MRTLFKFLWSGLSVAGLILTPFTISGKPSALSLARDQLSGKQAAHLSPQRRIVTVVAGGGTGGFRFRGNRGPASKATLVAPTALALGPQGDVFIADALGASPATIACQIEEVVRLTGRIHIAVRSRVGLEACRGIIVLRNGTLIISDAGHERVVAFDPPYIHPRLLAGSSGRSPLGDAGPARLASLYDPSGLAAMNGSVLVADTYHNRIREVNGKGSITTIAGDGVAGFSGDGGRATSAELNHPLGIAVDRHGNLYIADEGNNRIREVVRATGIIKTVVGDSNCPKLYCGEGAQAVHAKIDGPQAVAVDRADNLYIAASARVLKVQARNLVIHSIAGNGKVPVTMNDTRHQLAHVPARGAEMEPVGIAVNGAGNVLVVDAATRTIREIK